MPKTLGLTMDPAEKGQEIPSVLKSKILLEKHADAALLTLKIMNAPSEVVDALGLRPYKKKREVSVATMCELYLDARNGDSKAYRSNLELGQRMGQAFFNALSSEDQGRLRGHILDPFNKLGQDEVYKAIEFLMDTEEQ